MKRNNKKGFTIVELVIVIAVIGILATIMIPTFSNVTKNAQDAARDADAKALYTQYVADLVEDGTDVPATMYLKVTQKGITYYYTVTNGVVNYTETTDAPTGNNAVIYPAN